MTGVLSTPVRIYSSASVAGCATETDAAFEELAAVFEPPLHVGTIDVDIFAPLPRGKIAPMPLIDPLPAYVAFKRDTPTLIKAPGTTLRVSYANPPVELALQPDLEFHFYRRAPLIRWIEGGWIHGDAPEAPVVFRSRPFLRNDGTFAFYVPTEPARYAAELVFDYDAACSFGTAGAVVGIDVVVPVASAAAAPS